MHPSSLLLSSLVFLVIVLVATEAAPQSAHHKHAECARRVFRTLNTLCNHTGDLEYLRDSSYRCCKRNCELTEMMSFCTVVASSSEQQF